jgi:hypothetical protein
MSGSQSNNHNARYQVPENSPPTGPAKISIVLISTFAFLLSVAASAQGQYSALNLPQVTNRPYPKAYYNQKLPNAGNGGPTNHLMPNSDTMVNTVMHNPNGGSLITTTGYWHTPGLDDFGSRAIYYGQASDPVYQVSGCTGSGAFVNGQKFHAPSGAKFTQSDSDENFTLWDQTTDMVFSFYNWAARESLPACSGTLSSPCDFHRENGYCSAQNRSTGSGVNSGGGASTAGLSPIGNNVLLAEILIGHIRHGLRAFLWCNGTANGLYPGRTVFPANPGGTSAQTCPAAGLSDTNRPPNGSLFFLDYTQAQLDCFDPSKPVCSGITKMATWQFAAIEAMTLYGVTAEDTGNGTGLGITGGAIESEQAYEFYETHGYPGAQTVATNFTNYMNAHCSSPTCSITTRSLPHSLSQWNLSGWNNISLVGGKDVVGHMHIADPCVAMGLQGLSGGCAASSADSQTAPPAPTGLTATVE